MNKKKLSEELNGSRRNEEIELRERKKSDTEKEKERERERRGERGEMGGVQKVEEGIVHCEITERMTALQVPTCWSCAAEPTSLLLSPP